ncbi:alpha/beta hydrolase [Actinoplanes sp. DH11]|uniref:alpha/beta hydrolase n=1 Tax=Actinoplanes sp. DH11 TaxID=2857011 RepID=UPI001E3947AE|nr:alpha/beta hydrolase [Actinoplanes sp. DH11]
MSRFIDPQLRVALQARLEAVPGGFGAIPDILRRRAAVAAFTAGAEVARDATVVREDRTVAGPPEVGVRVYRPAGVTGALPGIYYIHGGGMVQGSVAGADADAAMLCAQVRAVVVSVEYRLAPEHPYPAALDDCYAGLTWMVRTAPSLGVDPDRVALYGPSAGGGLAIATALTARDRCGPAVRFLMPIYPMIDDRNETASSQEITDLGMWDRATNIEAWRWYLAGRPADGYAAPARADDLAGLPPTFIDVGTADLFRDEDITFAQRLMAAGVPTELHVYPGAYHGAEALAPDAELSRRIVAARMGALRRAFT